MRFSEVVWAAVGIAVMGLGGAVRAQEGAAAVRGDEVGMLTIADVDAALEALSGDESLDESAKAVLRQTYTEAKAVLTAAADNEAREEAYRAAMETAPGETLKVQEKLSTLPALEELVKALPHGEAGDMQQNMELRQAERDATQSQLADIEAEVVRMRERPVELSARLPEARRELAGIEAELAGSLYQGEPTAGRKAERVLLEAKRLALRSELAMLEEEQLSQAVRADLLFARRDLLMRELKDANAVLDVVEASVSSQLAADVSRISSLADSAEAGLGAENEAVRDLAEEVRGLAKGFEKIVQEVLIADEARDDVLEKLEALESDARKLEEQERLGALEGVMTEVLLEQQQRLPSHRAYEAGLKERGKVISAARLAGLDLEQRWSEQVELEAKFGGEAGEGVAALVAARREILRQLQTQNRALVRSLALLVADERHYLDKLESFREYLGEKLFWARSSAPIGKETVKALPDAFPWLLGPSRWQEFFGGWAPAVRQYPVRSVLVAGVVFFLLIRRRRFLAVIEETGLATRRISTDHYGHTIRALCASLLLALPIPLLIFYVGWALGRTPGMSDWMRGLTQGLIYCAFLTFGLWFLALVGRPKGLGTAHFGWREVPLKRMRHGIHLFLVVFIPGTLVLSCTPYEGSAVYLDSVGRLSFMAISLWVWLLLWKLCRPSDGVFSAMMQANPELAIARFQRLWYPLLVVSPLVLVVLAAAGYVLTSIALGIGYLATLGMICGGAILYGLTLRWFLIRERRLALAEAIAAREARREAGKAERAGDEEGKGSDETIQIEEEEEGLDLAAVGGQTRRLLRFVWMAAVTIGLWYFWSHFIPALNVLENVPVPFLGGIGLLGLLKAFLIVAIVSIITKNLPGLLEVAVLRATDMDAGTRNAITTLCQYAVIAVGVFFLADTLKLDWSKFGWIAAALSVGLGFGLQEVVANFVCGIIVLLERPIRVGDTVTVDEVTGTVTKIQMRATTITNWDRKEYVVPNKQFITGTVMNWTLTNPISRIVINVGVSYGSDTKKAREILVAVANDHPLVLDDPAPMATFDVFGASSLDLTLRCFIPNMDNRVKTISELNEETDRRFRAAGIEIAFPQLDVHLKKEG